MAGAKPENNALRNVSLTIGIILGLAVPFTYLNSAKVDKEVYQGHVEDYKVHVQDHKQEQREQRKLYKQISDSLIRLETKFETLPKAKK